MTEPLTWNSAYRHAPPDCPIYDELLAEQERDEAPNGITARDMFGDAFTVAEFLRSCWPKDRLLQLMMGGFLLALICLIAAGWVR